MSSHYEKKEPLEDDIIKKLIDRCVKSRCKRRDRLLMESKCVSRYVNVGLFYLRQIFFGKYDITVHTQTDKGTLLISSSNIPLNCPFSSRDRL